MERRTASATSRAAEVGRPWCRARAGASSCRWRPRRRARTCGSCGAGAARGRDTAAEPLQAGGQLVGRPPLAAVDEIRAEASRRLVPALGEDQLLQELQPALGPRLAHRAKSSAAAGGYTRRVAQSARTPARIRAPLEPRLPRIGSVDAVALEERAASLAKRSIKRESKLQALELAVRMMDLTTLEGADTPGKVAALCSKAIPSRPCRHLGAKRRGGLRLPEPRSDREARLQGSSVKVASVATAFPLWAVAARR